MPKVAEKCTVVKERLGKEPKTYHLYVQPECKSITECVGGEVAQDSMAYLDRKSVV